MRFSFISLQRTLGLGTLCLLLGCASGGADGADTAATRPAAASQWRELPEIEDSETRKSLLAGRPGSSPKEVLRQVAALDAEARELAAKPSAEEGMGPVVLASYFTAIGAPAADAIGPMLSDERAAVRSLAAHVLLTAALAERRLGETREGLVPPSGQTLLDGLASRLPALENDLRQATQAPDAAERAGPILIGFIALGERARSSTARWRMS